MADVIYKVQAPDGTILKIQGPEGATEAELQQAAEAHYASLAKASKVEPQAKPQNLNPYANPETVYDPVSGVPIGFGPEAAAGATLLAGAVGALKPFAGAAQFLGMNKPAEVVRGLEQTAEKIGGTPAQVAGFAGEVASPLPVKAGALVDKTISPLTSWLTAKMAAQGATQAAFNPVEASDPLDFLAKKAEQAGLGAVFGAGAGKAAQTIMAPQISPQMQMLKDMGMTRFTPGQLLGQLPLVGKGIQKAESAATSLPIAGSLIERGAKSVNEDFNRAVANRVLQPMGESVPTNIKAGEDLVSYVNSRIDDAYDNIAPLLTIDNLRYKSPTSPSGFTTTVKVFNDKLGDVTRGLPSSKDHNLAGMVKQEFDKYILDPLLTRGHLTGIEFREAEKNLGKVAYSYMRDPKYFQVGSALRELQSELRQELAAQNPALAKQLQAIHLSFRRHLPMERAASYVGAQDRVFSPAQFESGVKASSTGKGQFASGQSLMYPESQAALNVLGRSVPESGTVTRGMIGGGLLGAGALQAALPPIVGSAMLYNPLAMSIMTRLATDRPGAFVRAAPTVAPIAARAGALAGPQSLD